MINNCPERNPMSPILEIDVHGLTVDAAIQKIDKLVQSADNTVYRVRVIHGFNGGTRIRDAIRREFGYGLEPKVKQITEGSNPGITELVLKAYY